jgi:hypothetical protein
MLSFNSPLIVLVLKFTLFQSVFPDLAVKVTGTTMAGEAELLWLMMAMCSKEAKVEMMSRSLSKT